MSVQASIMLMVDVESALLANTLEGYTYLFDNLGYQGSTGQGTGQLVTGAEGEYWIDGTQADEIVLNWLTVGVASLPLTLPRDFQSVRSRDSEEKTFKQLKTLHQELTEKGAKKPKGDDPLKTVRSRVEEIQQNKGILSVDEVPGKAGAHFGNKMLDVTGNLATDTETRMSGLSFPIPEIVGMRGPAVDENVIHVADMNYPANDPKSMGWYWCGTVSTGKPGVYEYTMDVNLYKPVLIEPNKVDYQPVTMEFKSAFNIANAPMVNGFTKRGIAPLPI